MITLFYLVIWWLIGFLIIQTYQKFDVLIVDTDVYSYRLRVKILLSFLGVINLILIPILRVR